MESHWFCHKCSTPIITITTFVFLILFLIKALQVCKKRIYWLTDRRAMLKFKVSRFVRHCFNKTISQNLKTCHSECLVRPLQKNLPNNNLNETCWLVKYNVKWKSPYSWGLKLSISFFKVFGQTMTNSFETVCLPCSFVKETRQPLSKQLPPTHYMLVIRDTDVHILSNNYIEIAYSKLIILHENKIWKTTKLSSHQYPTHMVEHFKIFYK